MSKALKNKVKLNNVVDVVADYGADPTGVADSTTAIQNAVNYAISASHATVVFPPGGYKVTGTITIGEGVVLMGQGSQGSTENYGVSITHYSNSDLFKFDGSGTDFRGTGGGVKNMLLLKANGYSGGSAIYCYATSDNKRPGEMLSENVLIYGTGTGLWSTPIKIDGSAANTAGARGVRTTVWIKCRTSSASLYGWHLKQATHFYAFGCAFDTGGGAGVSAGVYMEGINDGIYWEGCGIAGSFTIIANDASNTTTNFHFSGKIGGSITVNDTQINGTMEVANSGGGIAIKSKSLRLVADNTSEFLALNQTTASSVTGDSTQYTVSFNTEIFDGLNNFAGNQFVCTIAGKYQFNANVLLSNLGAAHTTGYMAIKQTGSTTRELGSFFNPYAQSSSGLCSRSVSGILDLTYGDVVTVYVYVSGGTKVVNVYGTASPDYTNFSGKYLP